MERGLKVQVLDGLDHGGGLIGLGAVGAGGDPLPRRWDPAGSGSGEGRADYRPVEGNLVDEGLVMGNTRLV